VRKMSTDTGHGTIPERLIVLDEARDDGDERSSVEGLLRRLEAEGNIEAKEAIAYLAAKRSHRTNE